MAPLHAVLRKFHARDCWKSYSRELERYFEVNDVPNDNERVAVLLTVLSPSVYKVLRDSCHPELPRLKTYAELSELMRTHHSSQPSVFKHRVEFYGATQAPTESVSEWLGRVTRLAATCDFGNQLDTVLKDNFVSGLADRRVIRRLCEEKSSAPLVDLADMAEKYAVLCSTETSILDLPDLVLEQIILLLTPRERIPLGESCQRLKTLVFEDPQLLRYLDFSKEAHLTTMTHIQQYVENEKSCRHILKIDARYVECLKPGHLLDNSIGKAINLVELNIHGTKFEDIRQLGSFLQPLTHLVKLSIDWPKTVENDDSFCRQILQRPLSKLTYLSVNLSNTDAAMFTSSLSLCQQLKKLFIKATYLAGGRFHSNFSNSAIKQLTNLKIVQYHGHEAIRIKKELAKVLPDPERWTDFQLCGPVNPMGFYIEKDVEVCEELLRSERLRYFLNPAPWVNFNLRWAVNPECLLKEVLRITHEDVPDDLCCLSTFGEGEVHLLKVEHAKMLLMDPRCQIPFLYLNHELERGCDAHLLASAFPNLSELVLSTITRNSHTPAKDLHHRRCLKRKWSQVPDGQDNSRNLDSSFRMLVENTPNLRHFRLNPKMLESADWDLDALHLISAWKSLESLHMSEIPIEDGQFLIEIGKQCKNLQTLNLRHLSHGVVCSYEDALFKMLQHCRKLRNFTLRQSGVDQGKMFELLAKNVDLETVCINVNTNDYYNGYSATVAVRRALPSISDWINSFENLLRQCKKLITLSCPLIVKSKSDSIKAAFAVQRVTKTEAFRRRNVNLKLSYPIVECRYARCST